MFSNAASFNGDISSWDVSSVTDMSIMFSYASSFNQPLNWDTSSVTDMSGMFSNAASFNGDISSWDVSEVTDMSSMFFFATSFNSDISSWNVSSATNLQSMFDSASAFNQDISAWAVSSANDMSWMFAYASAFNQDISAWDVSSANDMANMFASASAFNQNLGDWYVVLNDTVISNTSETISIRAQNSFLDGHVPTYEISDDYFELIGHALSIKSGQGFIPGVYNLTIRVTGSPFGTEYSRTVSVTLVDDTRPTFTSASYLTGAGRLTAVFSEPLNDTIHYDRIHIRDAGRSSGGVSLDGAASKSVSGDTITLILNASQRTDIANMATPQLDIDAGAVFDLSGNGISAVSDNAIAVHDVPATAFVTTWRTTAASQSVTIPVGGSASTYTIDWGDGTTNTDVSSDQTHTYTDAGDYVISITGGFDRIRIGYDSAAHRLISIDQWGNASWTSMEGAFQGATNMVYRATDAPDLTMVTDMSYMFQYASSFNGDLSSWNVSQVTDMSYMFNDASSFNGDLSSWNVSSATSMYDMFYNTRAFNQNLGAWYVVLNDTTITSPSETLQIRAQNSILDGQSPTYAVDQNAGNGSFFKMVGNTLALKSDQNFIHGTYDVTISVTDSGGGLFGTNNNLLVQIMVLDPAPPTFTSASYLTGAGRLTAVFSEPLNDTIHYDRIHIRDAGRSSGGVSLDGAASKSVSGDTITLILNASQRTDIANMATPQLDIDAGAVFDLSGNGISAVSDNAIAVHDVPATAFVTTWRTTAASQSVTIPVGGSASTYTIDWGDGTTNTDVSSDQTHTYTDAGDYVISITGGFDRIRIGYDSAAHRLISIDQWGNASWTSMEGAFQGATNMVYRATDAPDLTMVTDMSYMFQYASSFNGDLSSWNVSQVTSMFGMFWNAASFNGDISTWNVSAVDNMGSMFNTATAFNGDISAWNVSAVTYMDSMFYNATAFNGDISVWNVSSVNDMNNMFYDARSFNQNLGAWYVVLADTTISSQSETLSIQAQNFYLDNHVSAYVVDPSAGNGSYFEVKFFALKIREGQRPAPGTYNVTIQATGSELFGATNAREVSITVTPQTSNARLMSITATYDADARAINVTYSEPINGTVQADRFHIRDGASGMNFALSGEHPVQRGVDTRLRGASGMNFALSGEPRISNDTITFVLNRPLDVILRDMAVPLLDIGQGATYDTYGNTLPAIAGHQIYIPDTFPPTLDSAVYRAGSLELTFSEPLNATVLSDRIQVRNGGSGQQGISLSNIPFGMLTSIPAEVSSLNIPAPVPSGTVLTFWPNSTIHHTIQNMTAPTILMFEAAVADLAGNPIAMTGTGKLS